MIPLPFAPRPKAPRGSLNPVQKRGRLILYSAFRVQKTQKTHNCVIDPLGSQPRDPRIGNHGRL